MNNTMKYNKLLTLQYCNALGIKVDTTSQGFKNDLVRWVFERKQIGEKYVEFLNSLGLNITNKETAEIGKGTFDTLVDSYNTTVITPYPYTNNVKRVLKYDFFPNIQGSGLIKYDSDGKIAEIVSVPKYINQIITQNPYNELDLIGYEDLFNVNDISVIVGMYGHIHDNDKEMKLKMLKLIKDKIKNNQFNVEYEYDRDSYFAAIYDNKTEKKVKSIGEVK
ncbi:MAG: hypothetical protein IJ068_03110 [Bacilli bacterium]|nr:hypothetical protein [Bacilli bacterium]